jgi:CDGSH-type Zn-finger protein
MSQIEERDNGPLIIKNAKTMTDASGAEMEVKEVMALCRCGQSANKPFCDGSHNEAGFSSANEAEPSGKDVVLFYEGKEATIAYNPLVCSHAGECVRIAKAAFDPKRRPWIEPDNTDQATLEDVVRSCPSGALRIAENEESIAGHLIPERANVHVQKDGPYWITGASIERDVPGKGGTEAKYVLCRCGLSSNKPYCDGSHYDQKWSDD